MKRDDVRKVFPEATDEQIDAILNGIGAELNPLKAQLEDATGRLGEATSSLASLKASEATLKAQLEEANGRLQQGMSAEELLAAREKAAEEREREFTLKSNGLEAKSMFVEAGFSAEDIEAVLPLVVSEDGDATKAAAKALIGLDAKRREAVEQSTKDALLKANPTLTGAGSGGAVSKEEFDKLPYAEKVKLVEENPELLKSFDN